MLFIDMERRIGIRMHWIVWDGILQQTVELFHPWLHAGSDEDCVDFWWRRFAVVCAVKFDVGLD